MPTLWAGHEGVRRPFALSRRLLRAQCGTQCIVVVLPEDRASVGCGALQGVDAVPITIEGTLATAAGNEVPRLLGQVDAGIREAYFRVMTALGVSGVDRPRGVVTLNFLPAAVRKTGSSYDLPLALVLAALGHGVPREALQGVAAHGEVSLGGQVLPARGIVSVALATRARGFHTLITSRRDAALARLVPNLQVIGVRSVHECVTWLCRDEQAPTHDSEDDAQHAAAETTPTVLPTDHEQTTPSERTVREPEALDLADIRGHHTPKTALAVAAAGRHNLLFIGPPGSGKSALARRMPPLLPPPSDAEFLEILKIHTVAQVQGGLRDVLPCGGVERLRRLRPLRAPHQTSSTASLLGGGSEPRPGEVTLAHRGLLFLDELPEFRREALEALRQPMEDGHVVIARVKYVLSLPADFQLVAAMNPCPCGYEGHPQRPCSCNSAAVARYRARISGPLLDRIDLQVEVPALDAAWFRQPIEKEWSTESLAARVRVAVARQVRRNRSEQVGQDAAPNGRLEGAALEHAVQPSQSVLNTLEDVLRAQRLSGRTRVRLLRVARTIADLSDREQVLPDDVLEATRLRGFSRRAEA